MCTQKAPVEGLEEKSRSVDVFCCCSVDVSSFSYNMPILPFVLNTGGLTKASVNAGGTCQVIQKNMCHAGNAATLVVSACIQAPSSSYLKGTEKMFLLVSVIHVKMVTSFE